MASKGGKREGAGRKPKYPAMDTCRIIWTVPKDALPALREVLEQYRK